MRWNRPVLWMALIFTAGGGLLAASPLFAAQQQAPMVQSEDARPEVTVRVSQGVALANLVHRVDPVYPELAKQARIEDTSIYQIEIARDGSVRRIQVVRCHPILCQAGIDAVRQWHFKPYYLNGEPVVVTTQVTLPLGENPGAAPAFPSAPPSRFSPEMIRIYGTPEQVADKIHALEAKLKEDPNDATIRGQLMDLYAGPTRTAVPTGEVSEHMWAHYLWFIEHEPTSGYVNPGILTCAPPNRAAVQRAEELWIKQTDNHPGDGRVLLNAAGFLRGPDRERSIALYGRVLDLPGDDATIAAYRADAAHMLNLFSSSVPPERRAELRQRIFKELEASYLKGSAEQDAAALPPEIRSRATSQTELREMGAEARFSRLIQLAKAAFDAGELQKARAYATQLLDQAPQHAKYWNYGNAIHDGNVVLGRVALREGDLVAARKYLLAAGQAPATPTLSSFGPNMSLANDLLEKGDRETVLAYFELCGKFWRGGSRQLSEWTTAVRAGTIPQFGPNLNN